MDIRSIIEELEPLASPRTKQRYVSEGAEEPLFGLTVKALKPIAKRLKLLEDCQQIAYDLFDTGNYDLMYLAGMIVDPEEMTEAKYDEWIGKSYFYMLGDFTVAICLSETTMAEKIATKWIRSGDDLRMSAGYSTYSWMIASRKDGEFDKARLAQMLKHVEKHIHDVPDQTRYSMYYFTYNLGVSYLPLHDEALAAAERIGELAITDARGNVQMYNLKKAIDKERDRGKLGFKRRNVRC